MKNKKRNILNVLVFSIIIFGFTGAGIITEDQEVSFSERRTLATLPKINKEMILSGMSLDIYEEYLLDHFPARDGLRRLKAEIEFRILRKMDNNNIFIVDNNIFKLQDPLSESSMIDAANKFNEIQAMYLQSADNVAYALIPDKSYFVEDRKGYVSIDYSKMENILSENINNMEYINLFDGILKIEDFYRTDLHWTQEGLQGVIEKLNETFDFERAVIDLESYEKVTVSPFYGVYYGQAALPIEPDSITYLTNEEIENIIRINYDGGKAHEPVKGVYEPDEINSIDGYSVFLGGNTPLMTLENPNAKREKELLIFRDSFGSSLAPLLTPYYSKITLIDLRYVSYSYIEEFVEISDKKQDVLFLYSTPIINQSELIRK